jgi:hypothetical protein
LFDFVPTFGFELDVLAIIEDWPAIDPFNLDEERFSPCKLLAS